MTTPTAADRVLAAKWYRCGEGYYRRYAPAWHLSAEDHGPTHDAKELELATEIAASREAAIAQARAEAARLRAALEAAQAVLALNHRVLEGHPIPKGLCVGCQALDKVDAALAAAQPASKEREG